MKIVEVEKKHYMLAFDDAAIPGSGYSFPCDKQGNIMWKEVSSQEILAFCKALPDRWDSHNGRVVEITNSTRYGICPCCGREVYFSGEDYLGAYACQCGHWYTKLGQEVKSPLEWKDLDEPLDEESYY